MSVFDGIKQGALEGVSYLKGENVSATIAVVEVEEIDAKEVRLSREMTQAQFAEALGVSVRNIQNWEQKHRPMNPAGRALFRILRDNPEVCAARPRSSDHEASAQSKISASI